MEVPGGPGAGGSGGGDTITVLSSLGEEARRRLLASGYVTLEDLWRMDARELASIAGVREEEAEEILEEAKLLKP